MRAAIRAQLNQIFVQYPTIGRMGYDFLRRSGLDRSTRSVKNCFQRIARQGYSPKDILDVGANYGGWSREVASVFSSARFYMIEPQEEMRPFLDDFCSNRVGSKWFLGGAGAEPGFLDLTIWEDYQGSAFLSSSIEAMVPDLKQRRVPIITIDHLINNGDINIPDLIKIDVQGYEMEVLQGGRRCLGKTDMFIIETSLYHPLGHRPSFYRVVELMEAYGYKIWDLADLKYRGDGTLAQIDVCFLRKQSPLAVKLLDND
jgi:FkbM family methyltransferase